MQLNLTEGVIWKTLLRYSLPVVLTSFLQSAYSLVDLALAGRFAGDSAMSAINNSGQVMMLLTQIIIGLTMGANILIGQYYGAKDRNSRLQTNRTLFNTSLICGVIAAALLFFLGPALLGLMKAPALAEATSYLRICAVGILPVFGYNALAAMMRGVGNSKQPLYCILVTALVNVALDAHFMGILKMGAAGAAWATLIAQSLAFFIALGYVYAQRDLYALGGYGKRIHRDKLDKMLKLGLPTALQMALVSVSWLTMTFLINKYGIEASAASGISAKIKDIAQLFIVSMGTAVSMMVAQCLGARDYERAKQTVHMGMKIALGVSVVIIAVVEICAPNFVAFFGPDEVTAGLAVLNLRIEIVAQVFFAVFMLHNALALGAGHTKFVLMNSIMNSIIVRLVLALILNHFFGLTGIFVACLIAPASSVPLGWLYERSGMWRKSMVSPVVVEPVVEPEPEEEEVESFHQDYRSEREQRRERMRHEDQRREERRRARREGREDKF